MAMYTYISSYTGFRSKGSFSFSEFYYSNDRTECSSSWVSPFLIHGFSVNPRILYGLRQSTLLQWQAYRRLIWGGNCGNGCRPSAAATVRICGPSRGSRAFCYLEERRRERRVACSSWEREGYDSISGGSVNEIINLLTDVVGRESVGVRESDSRSAAKSGRKMHIRRDDVCEIEKEVRVDECSEREEKHEGHDSWARSLRGEVVIKSGKGFRQGTRKDSSRDDKCKSRKIDWGSRQENQYIELDCGERMSKGEFVIKSEVEGYRHPRREEYLRDNFREARKDTSSSSYYSMESSGDLGSNMEESLQSNPERVVGESLSVSKNDLGWDRKDVSVEEVRQHNEYGSTMRYGESLTKRNSETQSIIWQDRVKSDVMEVDFDKDVEPSGKRYEVLGSHKSVSKSENQSKMRMEDMEESLTSSSNLVHGAREQYVENDKQVVGKIETRIGSKKLNRTSEMPVYDSRTASSSQTISDSRVKSREENTASNMNLSEETRRQHSSMDYQVGGKTELRKGSDILTKVVEIHDTDANHTFRRQMEDNSTSVLNSVQQAREQRNQNNQMELAQIELSKESQRHSNVLEIHTTDTKRAKNFQKFSKTRISEQEKNSSSVLNRIQESREQHHQTKGKVIGQHGSGKDSRNHTGRQEYSGNDVEMASSSSQTLVNVRVNAHEDSSMLVPQSVEEPRKQQTGASDVVSRKPLVMVTPPRSQLVVRGSQAHASQADENLESGSVAAYEQGKNSATLEELDSRIQRDEMYEGGALVSSSRLDNSSARFVGEFVDMLQKEISASDKLSMASRCSSEIQKESISSATASVTQDEKYKQQSPKRISTGSRTKGPSDEMWDVAGPSSSLEASEIEAPKKGSLVDGVMEANVQTDTGNVTARRSSRSLWSYIADTVRKGWGSRAESHTPTIKSGARTSSNESLNSESWFSGDEPEGDHDENAKKTKSGILKEPLLITQTQHASESMRSQEKLTQIKSDASTSMDLLETSSTFKSASSVSGKVDFERIEGEMARQNIPSMVASVDSSFPLTGTSTPSSRCRIPAPDRGEISASGKAQISRSGVAELDEEPVGEGATETTGTKGKDGQLKRRKLHRNKQVLRERFDEWEEAFRLEQEQRKTDEMFMREALLEARKAGDSWEVPVGAVLVQNGKIIARGYNLVEELRDSTAHAEMICIREASNLLRTWRLAETTLYVTLEPCPMCAGAILQARIDTVVWGAPNKLLGADGSWVSLFPGGEEGGNVSDRLPGPVHPFHPKITIRRGILAIECADVMQQFFQLRRKNKKSEPAPHLPVSNHPSKFFSKLHHIFNLMFCM